MSNGFLKLNRSDEAEEVLRHPNAFTLLTVIAMRARRSNSFNAHNLQPGEALIGDYASYGMTEKAYRVAKKKLEQWGLAAFRGANRGTIARLCDARVYDINPDGKGGQEGSPGADQGRTEGGQGATNKNERMKDNTNTPPNSPPQGEGGGDETPEPIGFDFRTGKFSGIESALAVWREAYPHIDLAQEIRMAGAWLIAHRDKPKHRIGRFLGNWLRRAEMGVNNGRQQQRRQIVGKPAGNGQDRHGDEGGPSGPPGAGRVIENRPKVRPVRETAPVG